MKRYFSGMTAQQAPRPRAARQALELPAGAHQTASRMPQVTSEISAFTSSAESTSVVRLDDIDENRLARSHRHARVCADDVRTIERSWTSVADVMALALRQRDARIVPVHE